MSQPPSPGTTGIDRRRFLRSAAGAGLLSALAGCEPPPETAEEQAPGAAPAVSVFPAPLTGAAAGEERYVMVSNIAAHPYWIDFKAGGEDAASELRVRWEYTGPADMNTPAQVNMLEQIIPTRPAGILVAALQPDALTPAIDAAVSAGVPVVTVDTDAPRSKRLTYLGTDNYQGGRVMGRRMVEVLGGKGKVGLATLPGQFNLEERIRGIRDVFKENQGMEIAAIVDDKGDDSATATAVVAMIQANPDIDLVSGINAVGAGVASAIRQTNSVGRVKAVLFDNTEPILNAIAEGVADSAIVQRAYMMAYLGVKLLHSFNHRTPYLDRWARNGIAALPNAIDTGVMVITRDRLAAFR